MPYKEGAPYAPALRMASNDLAADPRQARDDELLAAIASADTPPSGVRAAQAEFYERHVHYLHGVLRRRSSRFLSLAGIGAEDLVQETFERAFERAHTFTTADHDDPERLRRRTRAWLGRIAQNLLLDALSRVREVSASPHVDRAAAEERRSDPPASPRLAEVYDALAELSDREQDVLRVTALHLRATGHQRLPNAVCAELAARWGITSDNVRAIRSRAMKKLLARVSGHETELREIP